MIQKPLPLIAALLITLTPAHDAVAALAECPTQLSTMQTEADATLKDLYWRATHGQMSNADYNHQRTWHNCLKVLFYNTLRHTPIKKCDAILKQYRTLAKTPAPVSNQFGTCTPP